MSELDKMFEGNPIKKINKICDEMIAFARTAGTVVDCGACNNKGCNIKVWHYSNFKI
jgi:hypothetical protein